MKKTIVILAVVSVLVAALGGAVLVYAEDPTDTTENTRLGLRQGMAFLQKEFRAAFASQLDLTEEQLQEKQDAAFQQALKSAVDSGKITQEQADTMLKNRELNDFMCDEMQTALAKQFGLTAEELAAKQEEGMTIQEIGKEKGMTNGQILDAVEAAQKEALTAAVEKGLLTQEEADQILNRPGFGMGMGMGGRGDGMRMRGPSDDSSLRGLMRGGGLSGL